MSNIIDILEKMGQDARLRHATVTDLRDTLVQEGIDPAAREAILAGDERTLEECLEARQNVCCLIWRSNKDEDDADDADSKDDTQNDEGAKSQLRADQRVA